MQKILSAFYHILGEEKPVCDERGDVYCMQMALSQAQKAVGRTHPNPPVGAVIEKDGVLIAAGYTHPASGPHAEAVALQKAGDLAKGATLYATLEPCNHHGRTPPCTEAILAAGIKRVVFGVADKNPHVKGCGALFLQKHGVEISQISNAVLAGKCQSFLLPFETLQHLNRPYVILKKALSFDKKAAQRQGLRTKITAEESDHLVHRLRNACDAILVGAGTVRVDNPHLGVRLTQGRDPLRVIVDTHLSTDLKAHVYRDHNVLVCHGPQASLERKGAFVAAGVALVAVELREGRLAPAALLGILAEKGISSLLVEGGPLIWRAFEEAGMVDELWHFQSPQSLGEDALAASEYAALEYVASYDIGPDILQITRNRHL